MPTKRRALGPSLDGFVYRIPGPSAADSRWIARSVHGHVAHGRTPKAAARNLAAGVAAMAQASGKTLTVWRRGQKTDGTRFLRAGELVQA